MIYVLNYVLKRKKPKKIENNVKQANYRKVKFAIAVQRQLAAPSSKAVLRWFYASVLHNFKRGNQ